MIVSVEDDGGPLSVMRNAGGDPHPADGQLRNTRDVCTINFKEELSVSARIG